MTDNDTKIPLTPYPVDSPYSNDTITRWQFCLGWVLFVALLFGLGWFLWGPHEDHTEDAQNCHAQGYTWEECSQFILDGVEFP